MVKDRYTKLESDARLKEKTDPLLKSMSYDPATGVLKVTTESGVETQVFDLNIEKIPASISILREGNAVFIRIVNDDGTYTQSDVTDLLAQYSFIESVTLKPAISKNGANTSVTYEIKDASIKLEHLSSEVTSTITNAVDAAQLSASNANSSAVSAANSKAAAEFSESNAAASKTAASGYASKAEESSDRAAIHENNAKEYAVNTGAAAASAEENAKLSKSYAVGGTGIREGENTDNAKHYYEQAKATVSAGGLTVFIQSTEPDVNNCLWFKTANTNTQIGALLNVKDASGTVNEIYLITKAENVQGLSQLISDSLLGYAKKTDLDGYATESDVDTKLRNYLPLTGGTVNGTVTVIGNNNIFTNKGQNAAVVVGSDRIRIAAGISGNTTKTELNIFDNGTAGVNVNGTGGNSLGGLFRIFNNDRYNGVYYDADGSGYVDDNRLANHAYVDAIKPKAHKVTLTVANWDSATKAQTVNANGVTATNIVTVSPETKASADIWSESGVFCTEQGDGTLKFTCTDIPTADISVNVVVVG